MKKGVVTETLITKSFTFEAAHRIQGHKDVVTGGHGKCANLHGHSYKMVVGVSGRIAATGFVVDFAWISELVKNWVMKNWDHALLLSSSDLLVTEYGMGVHWGPLFGVPPHVYVMPSVPTAENMCLEVFAQCSQTFEDKTGAKISFIEIWETSTSMARCDFYEPD